MFYAYIGGDIKFLEKSFGQKSFNSSINCICQHTSTIFLMEKGTEIQTQPYYMESKDISTKQRQLAKGLGQCYAMNTCVLAS